MSRFFPEARRKSVADTSKQFVPQDAKCGLQLQKTAAQQLEMAKQNKKMHEAALEVARKAKAAIEQDEAIMQDLEKWSQRRRSVAVMTSTEHSLLQFTRSEPIASTSLSNNKPDEHETIPEEQEPGQTTTTTTTTTTEEDDDQVIIGGGNNNNNLSFGFHRTLVENINASLSVSPRPARTARRASSFVSSSSSSSSSSSHNANSKLSSLSFTREYPPAIRSRLDKNNSDGNSSVQSSMTQGSGSADEPTV